MTTAREAPEIPETPLDEPTVDIHAVDDMLAHATVVQVEPGGVLLIGNVGSTEAEALRPVAQLLHPTRAVFFPGPIEAAALTAQQTVDLLYKTSALADAVLTEEQTDQGPRIKVKWPNGHGTLAAGLIADDITEAYADRLNRLYATLNGTQPIDVKDLPH